jgi:hypothetical protein
MGACLATSSTWKLPLRCHPDHAHHLDVLQGLQLLVRERQCVLLVGLNRSIEPKTLAWYWLPHRVGVVPRFRDCTRTAIEAGQEELDELIEALFEW